MINPYLIRNKLSKISANSYNQKLYGASVGAINKIYDEAIRYLVYWFLFTDLHSYDVIRSRDLSPSQKQAIISWVGLTNKDGVWLPRSGFKEELDSVVKSAKGLWRGNVDNLRDFVVKSSYNGDNHMVKTAVLLGGNVV